MKVNIDNYLKYSAFFMFSLLTFHVTIIFIIAYVYGYSINDPGFILIKMWKEILAISGIFICIPLLIKSNLKLKGIYNLDVSIFLICCLGLMYVITSHNQIQAIWSYRSLFGIFLFYFFGRLQNFSIQDFKNLLQLLFLLAVLAAIIGICQVEFFEDEFFLYLYGIRSEAGSITNYYEKLRAQGTFVTPHELGLYLITIIFATPFIFSFFKKKSSNMIALLGILIILIGLAYTMSRTTFVIFGIGLLVLSVLSKRNLKLIAMVLLIIIPTFIFLGAVENFSSAYEGTDSSTSIHLRMIQEAITMVLETPQGIGLGKIGVVVRRFDPSAMQYEGEFFNLSVQIGILGAFLYLFLNLLIMITCFSIYFTKAYAIQFRYLAIFICLVCLGMTLRDLILPRDTFNYSFGWFIIGAFYSAKHRFINLPNVKPL